MRFELQSDGALLQGEDFGHGPNVVLLHAGGEQRQVWDPVVETLVAQGYRCVTLDQRGHGESGGARDDLFELFVRVQARVASPAPTTRFDHALALLKECAADRVPHLAGTLLEHLRRTELWLDRWEAPEHVRLAG